MTLAKQLELIINTKIQNINISVFFNSRSVFVVAVIRILEGERDCGQQALVTPTFQRSHFVPRSRTYVSCPVRVQCVKSMFLLCEKQKSGFYMHHKPICAQRKKTVSVFHCFVMARIAFHKNIRLASAEQ